MVDGIIKIENVLTNMSASPVAGRSAMFERSQRPFAPQPGGDGLALDKACAKKKEDIVATRCITQTTPFGWNILQQHTPLAQPDREMRA